MIIALALLFAKSLALSFEYKDTNPYSLFPYYNAVTDTNYLGNLSNPAYLPLWKAAYINAGYAKPYMMGDLNASNLRAGYSSNDIGFQAAWSSFGIDEYGEDIIEGNFGYKPWKFLSTGLGISYYYIFINTDEIQYKYGTADFKFSLLFLPFDWVNIGLLQENIYAIWNKDKNGKDLLYPNSGFGIAIKPAGGITLIWNIDRIYYGYINSFSVTANMLPFFSIKGGYSHETSLYSFSVNLLYKKISVSYGLSHHTYLGSTHKIGLTVCTADFIIEEINYNKGLARRRPTGKAKKIDINNSSIEELIDSNIFSKEIAERIIKYRNTIGPISKKSLIQIGLAENEFKKQKEYIQGLVAEPTGEKPIRQRTSIKINNNTKTGYDIDTRKRLFQRLLEKGLNAGTALELTEKAKNTNKSELIRAVKESSNIDEEQKKIIIEICENSL